MRRTIATLLITGVLSSSMPMMMRDRGDRGGRDSGGDHTIVRIIRNIIRHLIPMPADDTNTINPPRP